MIVGDLLNFFGGDLPVTGAYSGWSLRRVNPSYTGNAIQVRRSSDNTTQDIGFVGQDLDTASLLSFVGSGDGFVSIWYDQYGNRNFTQTTAANQPQIVNAGSLYLEGGLPSIRLNATRFMSVPSSTALFNFIHNGGEFAIFAVFKKDFDALNPGTRLLANTTSTNQAGFVLAMDNSVSEFTIFRAVTVALGAQTGVTGLSNNFRILHTIYGDANDATVADRAYSFINKDGRSADNTRDFSISTANAFSNLFLGRQSNGTFPLTGNVQEIVIFNSQPTPNLRNGIANYWNL